MGWVGLDWIGLIACRRVNYQVGGVGKGMNPWLCV
jgi:hypothetical protein